jgi:hypothetical protein
MTLFSRKPTSAHTQFQNITDAYAAFGLTPPTRAIDIRILVNNNGVNVNEVAARLAQEALTTDLEPADWYAAALDQVREAQAQEALTGAFNRSYSDAVTRALPQYLQGASTDLTPALDKIIRRLTTAAKKLPAGKSALDPEANLSNDTGTALMEARNALTQLGTAASIYQVTQPGDIPVVLNTLLPVVDLPDATPEQIKASIGIDITVINTAELSGTYAIRRLAQDAKDDIDIAIINIARGEYEGTTLGLATPDELRERRTTAITAHKRETIREGSRVRIG